MSVYAPFIFLYVSLLSFYPSSSVSRSIRSIWRWKRIRLQLPTLILQPKKKSCRSGGKRRHRNFTALWVPLAPDPTRRLVSSSNTNHIRVLKVHYLNFSWLCQLKTKTTSAWTHIHTLTPPEWSNPIYEVEFRFVIVKFQLPLSSDILLEFKKKKLNK